MAIPKAELHLHIEGTLEPELAFELAERNGMQLPYTSVDELRRAYSFDDLQSFLNLYYALMAVLQTEQDFTDLAAAYLTKAREQGVRHAEIFFDPQAHTQRGVGMGTIVRGLAAALENSVERYGMTTRLILCFLRDQPEEDALRTLEEARPYFEHITGVGLDSAEAGHPPEKFREVFARARDAGMRCVAHAGEEGPPDYVRQALDLLQVERIDHGVRSLDDPSLVERLRQEQMPLTVCPFSNVRLQVVQELKQHPLPRMLDAGLMVTINSDDPSYFGGYVEDNFRGIREALGIDEQTLRSLARNSFTASFISDEQRAAYLAEVDAYRFED